MKPLLLTGENNLINWPVFAGFYRSEIVFQPAGDRPDRTGLKFGPTGPDRFKNIGPVTTLEWVRVRAVHCTREAHTHGVSLPEGEGKILIPVKHTRKASA